MCACHAEDVLAQPAYMLFYSRCQPRPSLPDLAARAAVQASSSTQDKQPPLPAPGHGPPAMQSAGISLHCGPRSLPHEDPVRVEAEEAGRAAAGSCSSDSGVERGAERRPEPSMGLHLQDLSCGAGPAASKSAPIGSQEVGVFEGRGLCRGEPADDATMPLQLAKAH